MMFRTKWGQAIAKVMANYQPGSPALMTALEAVVLTAISYTKEENRDQIAKDTCQQYHDGPAQGLVCKACFDVAEGKRLPAVDVADINMPVDPAIAKQQAEVDAAVRKMVTESDGPEAPAPTEGKQFGE